MAVIRFRRGTAGWGYWARKPEVLGSGRRRAARVPRSRLRGSVGVSVPSCLKNTVGRLFLNVQVWSAPRAARCATGCHGCGAPPLTEQPSSPTHRAAFHPRPGKDKKLSCKFCNLAVTTSTHACGPHCAASAGRSLALRAVWHPQPSLAPCRPPCWSALGACIPEPDSGSPALPKDVWGVGGGGGRI